MSSTVEQIKARLSIVDVVESYIKLDHAGANLKGKCPFHNEKTPSFFVSPERGTYYCFGCGAKGDIFEFVEQFEGLDFMGALRSLAARAGVEITHENPKARSEKERLYAVMEEACRFFESLLNIYPEAKEYLRKRGLKEETIKEFRLGFIPLEWRKLHSHLRSKGYSDLEIEKVGLAKRVEKPEGGSGYYDRFRGRVMFPITDSGGRVIAFTGRIFEDDGKSAKYLNSPDTVLFNKSSVLYGIDKAKSHIRRMGFSVLVEGQMDLIMSHQEGYKNTVASSGTALSDSVVSKEEAVNNLGMVRRLSPNMIIAYDADVAGLNAAERAAQIGLSLGMDVKIASVPSGKDPADYLLENPTGWKDVLKSAKHVIDFSIDRSIREQSDPRKLARAIKDTTLPLIAALSSRMEQGHFVSTIHAKTGIAEEAIWEDIKKIHVEHTSPKVEDDLKPKRDSVEKKLLGIIFWQEHSPSPVIDINNVKTRVEHIVGAGYFEGLAFPEQEKGELIFQAEVSHGEAHPGLLKEVDELLLHFEENHLKDRLAGKIAELARAEKAKDVPRAQAILEECQGLSSKLALLRKK